MEKEDSLFKLVKSLNAKEIRFIHRLASSGRKGAGLEVKLLDAMSSQEVYRKEILTEKFKDLNGLRLKLKRLTLLALRILRDGKSADSRISNYLEEYRIYYERGLYDAANRVLKSAESEARNHHKSVRLIEILHLRKHRLLETENKHLSASVAVLNEELDKELGALTVETKVLNEYHRVFAAYRTEEAGPLKARGKSSSIPLSDNMPSDASFYAKLYAMGTDSILAKARKDNEQARILLERMIELWNENPLLIEDDRLRYLILQSNLAMFLLAERSYDCAKNILSMICDCPDQSFNARAETFQNVANIRIVLALNDLETTYPEDWVEDIEKGLSEYSIKINPARQFSIWYNLFLLFFVNEEFAKARHWVEQILGHKNYKIRKEIQYSTRLLELIVYFETENVKVTENAIAALDRLFRRHENLTDFKRKVMGAIQQVYTVVPPGKKAIFKSLLSDISEIKEQWDESDLLALRAVEAWAKSRLHGKPIRKVLKAGQ